ncbi:alcohol dehydrogenase catalytic domain-containing protein [Tsukamurella sp. 8F]|uniref:zinc-dependent alcohol dehydrogenase n=1 Tax=unclassified Tsukamurella TaxID=2633480 RepID=UPI0023B90F6C|nr:MULTISPECIES: alcohol dehydrogenase catalytic domain-containing protein [unclassified Tsukamurella]MDF0532399.1 alcohol dehydrogenase catalytic domain-containing protein [Tsukamurella sp. 8J]MDF0588615.1 alcohol dehydrogenase catalytic domain-containing protein [Tsukamurella sp. 8F]
MDDLPSIDPALAYGYPVGPQHHPLGRVRHLLGVAAGDTAIPATRIMLERSARQRAERLKSAVRARRRVGRGTMRALIIGAGGRVGWHDVPAPPAPGPLAALVHPIAVATCDIDRPMGLGRTPFPLPMHFGHECVAEVVEVGERVTTVHPGDRVVVPFQISCGTCGPCRSGLTSNCVDVPPVSMYGFGLAGGHWGGAYSDLLTVPYADGMLVPLPNGVDPAAAASVADNVVDGYRAVAPHLPDLLTRGPSVEVLILSEIGRRPPFSASVVMYAGLIAKALGAGTVHLVDRRPHVRRHAAALGLHPLTPRELRKLPGVPLVVDSTGTSAGIGTAIKHTAPDGTCVSLSSIARSSKLPTALMYGRNVTHHLGRAHARANIPAVLDLMASGALRPERVTTHLGSLDRADTLVRDHLLGEATKTIAVE